GGLGAERPAGRMCGEPMCREAERRLDGEDEAGLGRVAAPWAPVVRDVRVAVHRATDPVPAEVEVDLEPIALRGLADRVTHVAGLAPGLRRGDARGQRLLGHGDDALVL